MAKVLCSKVRIDKCLPIPANMVFKHDGALVIGRKYWIADFALKQIGIKPSSNKIWFDQQTRVPVDNYKPFKF